MSRPSPEALRAYESTRASRAQAEIDLERTTTKAQEAEALIAELRVNTETFFTLIEEAR
jgi:hypothetical protein